ncbi:hypothetical protein VA599_21835, partial [Chromobacterium sp. TRC.1.1.SA]
RQLRRRTIPAPSPSVNRFFEKKERFLQGNSQPSVLQCFSILSFSKKDHITCIHKPFPPFSTP